MCAVPCVVHFHAKKMCAESMADELTKEALEQVLGFPILNIESYRSVFTHKSACRETGTASYERLEFIGDSIINFVVARHLFELYPCADEGFLTKARTKIVSGKCLGEIARQMGLQRFVRMNSKAMKCGWTNNTRILEDVFESLVGAMFFDLGLAATTDFLLSVFQKYVDYNDLLKDTNFKDALMRLAQQRGLPLPTYHVTNDPQVSRVPNFDIVAEFGGCWFGRGRDSSKKAAEQLAARHVLACLGMLDAAGHVRDF